MLETVLNVGMCETAARGLIALTGNPRLAWDCYRRLIESFASVVHGVPTRTVRARGLRSSSSGAACRASRELSAQRARGAGPRAPAPLRGADRHERSRRTRSSSCVAAATAVLESWDAPKAREYRRLHGIPDDLGTAVIVQRMVFGNAGGLSGAGVGFTRDPALGDRRLYMDFLLDAQGEDIVAGRQTAEGLSELACVAPDAARRDRADVPACSRPSSRDAQEFELTVQEGELFLLQTRTAKRTPWAALRIATDQVRRG